MQIQRILLTVVVVLTCDECLFGQDNTKIRFVRPFAKAFAEAKEKNRMIFLKPIYGGLDAEGAEDYRCGRW